MNEKGERLAFRLLTERFKRSAMATNFGYMDKDQALQTAGLRALTRAVRDLDLFGPDARLALVPLLDDLDPSIRVFAAGYLIKAVPDRALSVLQDLDSNGPFDVSMTAGSMLRNYRNGKLNM